MKLAEIVAASDAVAATRSRNAKRDELASCLTAMAPPEVRAGASYLAGELPQGKVGVGPALLRKVAAAAVPSQVAQVDVAELHSALDVIANASGKGSTRVRRFTR